MIKKTQLYLSASILIFAGCLLGQTELITKNNTEQERKIQDRIEIMKQDPESLYFKKTESPLAEQEKIALDLVKKIEGLSKTEGFEFSANTTDSSISFSISVRNWLILGFFSFKILFNGSFASNAIISAGSR